MGRLLEMKGTESINDNHMWDLIHECIDDINTKTDYQIEDDLMWLFGETTGSFGTTFYPTYEFGEFLIVLNKHMVGEEDNAIKNTICHELCHYIHNKEMLENGILYWYDEDTLRYSKKYQRGRDSSHGQRWKQIADEVSVKLQLNPPISRTNTFQLHNNVGEYAKSKSKYVITCKNCGQVYTYQKATPFAKNPNQELRPGKYRWTCGKCHRGGNFEVEKQS